MNILFFGSDPQINGIFKATLELARHLKNLGHNVFGASQTSGEFDKRSKDTGFNSTVIKSLPFMFSRQFRKFLKAHKPDVICISNPADAQKIARAAKAAKIPVVWHAQSQNINISPNELNHIQHIICAFEFLSGVMKSRFGDNIEKKTSFAPFGLRDLHIESHEPDKSNQNTLLFAGSISPEKGLHHLINAFANLPESTKNTSTLQLVGTALDQNYLEHLKDISRDMNIQEQVIFLGQRDDLANLVFECDIFIAPSIHEEIIEISGRGQKITNKETYNLNVLRAMRSANPVIVSTNDLHRDIVIDQETGLHVPPSDPEAMTEAIEALCSNQERKQALGQGGRARFDALFRIENTAKSFEQALENATKSFKE